MKILAIETSTKACSVALCVDDQTFTRATLEIYQQGQVLLPYVDELLKEASCKLSELDAVAVSNGPGSFVGLRLGVGVAQGLAFAHDLPVIALSSLAVLAQSVYRLTSEKSVQVIVDAHMNEVYWGQYQLNEKENIMEAIVPDCLCAPSEVIIPSGQWHVVDPSNATVPEARDVLTLASIALEKKQTMQSYELQPYYLRTQSAWKTKV